MTCLRLLLAALLCCNAARAAEPTRCLYVEVASLPISYTGPALQPTVQGKINDTPATLLLDTGTHRTLLTRTGTDRRGLTLGWSDGALAHGVGGSSAMYAVRLRQFSVGPASRGSTSMMVINEMGSTPSFDGIVGADFLMQTDLEIDLARKAVKFYRARDCAKTWLGYWDTASFDVPFLDGKRDRGNPELQVEINGVKLVAILDTGASGSTITLAAARRLGVTPASPGVTRVASASGVGASRIGRWSARFDSFRIGGETIEHPRIDILDIKHDNGRVDVLLGADFLRAHRVLIANSQDKVYLSYLGGSVFGGPVEGVAPWIVQEAEGGNPDAQLHLSHRYRSGRGVARDSATATAWLDRAAAQRHPGAVVQQARRLRGAGKPGEAIAHLRAALDQHPGEASLAFELFLAQTHAGERDAARSALAAFPATRWPRPIADYFLGKIDAATLMEQARDEDSQKQARTCEAGGYIADLHWVTGDPARARQVLDSVKDDCRRTPD